MDVAASTQVDRVFGFIQETPRRCTICEGGAVVAVYNAERVLRLVPEVASGGAMMLTELYFAS